MRSVAMPFSILTRIATVARETLHHKAYPVANDRTMRSADTVASTVGSTAAMKRLPAMRSAIPPRR
jgi:hypothetical protein